MLTALTSEEEARFPGMASSETEKLEVKTKKSFFSSRKLRIQSTERFDQSLIFYQALVKLDPFFSSSPDKYQWSFRKQL